jgi:hypothetical protein
MNRLLLILFFFCVYSHVYAQTPYDAFAPEVSRPILDVVQDMDTYKDSLQSSPMDAPLATTDDVSKWLSPDPLSDKYPEISPYSYCGWNPVKYIDPDGRDIYTINEETGTIEQVRTEGDNHSYYLTNGTSTSFVGSFQQNENGLVPLSGNVAFNNTSGKACGFSVKEGNESRSYISPNALASLIGAVGSLGYTDVAVIGFSLCNGASPSPSISHKNGNVGDLRYLRADGVSAPTLVKGSNFDFRRNEAMTAALSKFGWTDMISERVGGYLLPHTSAASERGIRTNHSNHLHIQGYHPSILETYMGINFTDIIVNGKR